MLVNKKAVASDRACAARGAAVWAGLMRSAADQPYGVGYPRMNKVCHKESAQNESGPLLPWQGKAGRSLNLGDGFFLTGELPRG